MFCLGNSLPHIENGGRLRAVFAHWHRHLAPGGRIVVQLLNYARIMRQRERIIGTRREGPLTVVRFYDFTEPRLTFNILTIDEGSAGPAHTLISTPLTPFTAGEIADAARDAGCGTVTLHASLRLDLWSEDARDVVVVAG